MSFVKFLMLLSLVVWLGGLIFFAFVVAPTVFSVLPTRHLAGSVVTRSLGALHWMGIISAIVFIATSFVLASVNTGAVHPFAARNVLVYVMLALTCVSEFVISTKMSALRAAMGEIDKVPVNDPARIAFNQLHVWSTRVESTVFLLGLVVLYLVARKL